MRSFALRSLSFRSVNQRRMASESNNWERIIRFVSPSGEELYGEPIMKSEKDNITQAKVIEGNIFKNFKVTSKVVEVKKLLSPLPPSPILCIGLNYKRHAHECKLNVPKFPVLFSKNPNAIQNPFDPIIIPKIALDPPEVDYEAELAVIIGKHCKNVSEENALDYVLGYTCANDVSARKWQVERGGSQWCFGKGFDTFCPLGPVLVSTRLIPDPNKLKIGTVLNGQTVQSSNTEDMIFDVKKIIAFLSQSTTLLPGTVIITGTPEGVGFTRNPPLLLKSGDKVTISIEKIGDLVNNVIDE